MTFGKASTTSSYSCGQKRKGPDIDVGACPTPPKKQQLGKYSTPGTSPANTTAGTSPNTNPVNTAARDKPVRSAPHHPDQDSSFQSSNHQLQEASSERHHEPFEQREVTIGPFPDCRNWEEAFERSVASQVLQSLHVPDHQTKARATDKAHQDSSAHSQESTPIDDTENFWLALLSNIQWRRAMRTLSAQISQCQKVIKIMQEGKNGVNEILKRVGELNVKRTPSAAAGLKEAQDKLERFQKAIHIRRQQEAKATTRLHHIGHEQRRRDARLYDVSHSTPFPATLPLASFPVEFFHQLDVCRNAKQKLSTAEDESETLAKELEAAEAEVEQDVHQLWRNPEEAQKESLMTRSEKLLGLYTKREAVDAKVKEASQAQLEANQALYIVAERSLVAQGVLPPQEGGPIGQPERKKGLVDAKAKLTPTSCTPVESPRPVDDEHREHMRFVCELYHQLKIVLNEELNNARKALVGCEHSLENVRHEFQQAPKSLAPADSMKVDLAYFEEKRKRTGALIQAEDAYEDALRRARDAGLPGVEAKSEGFSDHSSDGYALEAVNKYVAETDVGVVRAWLARAQSADAPGFDVTAAQEYTFEEVDGFEDLHDPAQLYRDAEVFDIRSPAFGESFSVVCDDKRRGRIDKVTEQWRDGDDGFWRRSGSACEPSLSQP